MREDQQREGNAVSDNDTRSFRSYFQNRVMAGLFATLPLFVTLWVIQFTYILLIESVLNPFLQLIFRIAGIEPGSNLPWWWTGLMAPLLVLILLSLVLFLIGGLARSRIYRMIDWIFRHLPVVKTVYDAVSNLIRSLDKTESSSKFEKVVLFDFPNSGVKSLGFVTNTLVERDSGRKIYAVMLLTGVMPPSGFTLFVPVEDVIELDWTPTQAIQAIVSGGISAPGHLQFERS
jgi:uncharacterized membrane protein